jgi:hypothetical protein
VCIGNYHSHRLQPGWWAVNFILPIPGQLYAVVNTFTGIKNEGERLRVKLAFFLAMMRLSREKGGGRHPGFLIIDQPGSNEMVPTDFNALAQIFQHINHEFGADIQILCFTARPQFQNATDSARVYGPQNPPFAF